MLRQIAFSTGEGMGDEMIIMETDAPQSRLNDLETESCNVDDYEDVPNWFSTLQDEGYIADYVDEHQHITPYSSSAEWMDEYFNNINEIYYIS